MYSVLPPDSVYRTLFGIYSATKEPLVWTTKQSVNVEPSQNHLNGDNVYDLNSGYTEPDGSTAWLS